MLEGAVGHLTIVADVDLGVVTSDRWTQMLETAAQSLGPWLFLVMAAYCFVQTGLPIGPLFPGTPVLFAFGLWAGASGLWMAAGIACALGGILGLPVGYAIGKRFGDALESRLKKPKLAAGWQRACDVYQKWGGWASAITPFLPVVRSVGPLLAGVSEVPPKVFLAAGTLGTLGWAAAATGAGAGLGQMAWVQENLGVLLTVVLVLMVVAPLVLRKFAPKA